MALCKLNETRRCSDFKFHWLRATLTVDLGCPKMTLSVTRAARILLPNLKFLNLVVLDGPEPGAQIWKKQSWGSVAERLG